MELLTLREVCAFFGGSRPLHPSTAWRWVKSGQLPKPIKVGRGTARWLRSELDAALQRSMEGRR
jgi:predicted DNA-binding transcriptional regulator AlpA